MSRSQQNQVYQQASANSRQDQGNAQGALAGVGAGLTKFNAGLDQYFQADPYKAGGAFQTDQNTIAQDRANANSNALGNELNLSALRTGENTAGYAPTLAEAQRKATIDTSAVESQADAQRIADETKYQQFGVEQEKFPVQAQEGVYGSSIGGANNALNTAESAAKQPSIWDEVFNSAIKGAAAGATAGA